MIKRFALALALSALTLACALNQAVAQSGADGISQEPKPPTRAKQMPFRGTIVKVDLEKKTIALAGKERDRVFHIIEESRIRRAGQPVKLEDVRVGDTVGGLARANGENRWDVLTLNLGEKPDGSAAKEVPQRESAE
jgi:hypothetical protein